jgi:hypothetical protein
MRAARHWFFDFAMALSVITVPAKRLELVQRHAGGYGCFCGFL